MQWVGQKGEWAAQYEWCAEMQWVGQKGEWAAQYEWCAEMQSELMCLFLLVLPWQEALCCCVI